MVKKIRKKTKRRTGRVFITLLILILIFNILGINLYQYFNNTYKSNTNMSKLELNSEKQDEVPKKDTLSIIMVGDSLIHDKIYNEALKYGDNTTYDFTPMLSLIKPIVEKYDLAYYNQETILGGCEIGLSSYPAFNSPYEVGVAMIDAGFDMVSLATNHTLDRGEKAIINSRNFWDLQENILAVGSYTSKEQRNKEKILEKNNITYTMLNYTYGTNGIKVPNDKEYLVNVWPVTGNNPNTDIKYQNYKEQVKKDIQAVRDKVDVLMVAMHWGVEYQYNPNSYQKDMAKYLADLGVDIIIGTHPHVIQPIEWIDDTLVIYSLGNFISAHEVVNLGNRIGLMTSIQITKTREDDNSKIEITNLENELLYTYYTSDYRDIKVIPFSKINEQYLSNYKQIYNDYTEIVKKYDNSISVKTLNS